MDHLDHLDAAMAAYYDRGREQDRLTRPKGELELVRTQEIVLRALPAAPAVVADVGGGPGRYATWLAELGHEVEHRDLMPLHVEQLRAAGHPRIRAGLGDARELDLEDASVDTVLLLGPLYHLRDREDRVQALREARRVVRPGGPVVVAAISRWAPRLDGALQERLYEQYPEFVSELPAVEGSGDLPAVEPGAFLGYTHRPDELAREVTEAGLRLDDLVGVEGLPLAADDLAARLADPVARQVVLDAARAVERVPELLGMSPHLVATARRVD